MIKASSSLQDLRSGLYGKRKAEWLWRHARASAGSSGADDGRKAIAESGPARIGLINHVAKCAGARSEGNPHAACEVAGAGNGATDTAKRARRGKPRIQPSRRPDGPPRQFPTLHLSVVAHATQAGKAGRDEERRMRYNDMNEAALVGFGRAIALMGLVFGSCYRMPYVVASKADR